MRLCRHPRPPQALLNFAPYQNESQGDHEEKSFDLHPDTLFEEALKIGQKNKISSFLVVDNGKLVGITTESDIVRLLTRALGLEEEGSRITIEDWQEIGGRVAADYFDH